ncbi:MAG TPA: rRNA maturation RNase YbeY [Candidatus Acidoferrum sp.]|jgi:probable rRNA maturation factor
MILNRQREVRVARGPLEVFLRRVQKELGMSGEELSICFVSDAEIARMNKTFRKKNGPTDVLSFPVVSRKSHRRRGFGLAKLSPNRRTSKSAKNSPDTARRHLGDIAISPATAKRNAAQHQRTFAGELRILVLHGVLHLLGYDHETDRGEMDRVESRLRQKFGLE